MVNRMSNKINSLKNVLLYTLILFAIFFCGISRVYAEDVTYMETSANSILHWLSTGHDLTSGYYKLTVNDVTYQIHLYVYDGDQVWNSNMTFGDANDVGAAGKYAQNMVAVLVRGNVTINSGVTVTAYKSTYGGPKGMLIYTTGTLENNGTISMYGRGAYAPGQNVYLWYDDLNGNGYTGFTVPAGGAAGAVRSTTASLRNDGKNSLNGNNGANGTGRATGGGGSGSVRNYVARMYPGSGAAGTSYSGGSGGGAAATDRASSRTAGDGSTNGGPGGCGAQGGAATCKSGGSTNGWGQAAGGGQGNGPGNSVWSHATASVPTQDTGTGGLLILFAGNLNNKGTITANGVKAPYISVTKWTGSQGNGQRLSGGSSGGGSVNIFYSNLESRGTITADGGARQTSANYQGGAGGNGTVTLSQLVFEEEYLHPTLSTLTVDKGTLTPIFDPETKTYYVTLPTEESYVNINAETTNSDNKITGGVGEFNIPCGTSTHNIVITSKIGLVEIYKIEFYRPPSSYKYLKSILIDDKEIEGFTPTKTTYNVTVPYDSTTINLTALAGRGSQQILGTGEKNTTSGNNTYIITVISEDGQYTTDYVVNIFREHSSLLKSLSFDDYALEPTFDPETNSYSITIMSTALSLSPKITTYDEEATYTLSGFGYIKQSQTATIKVTEPNSSPTTYTVKIIKEGAPAITDYTFSYMGEYQTFVVPATGYYKIELWGAQGGNAVGNNSQNCSYGRGKAYGGGCGGFGAYTTGTIRLEKGETLYVYVGQRGLNGASGKNRPGGWNGGGSSTYDHSDNEASGSGGGATDIRLVKTSSLTTWDEFNSLKSRIMVAAGGGGGSDVYAGGNAGTLSSVRNRYSNIATQTSGYRFGAGENFVYRRSNIDVAGGGSGYFGGYSTASSSKNYGNYGQTGTGGSSFVSGCTGCVAISEESTSLSDIQFTNSNVHYSGYEFTDIQMIAGGYSMPTTSTGYSVGNASNGFARITLVNKSENNFLSFLSLKATHYQTEEKVEKTYTPTFSMETLDYYVTLDSMETLLTISAKPEDSLAKIDGLKSYSIPKGTTDIPITVTAENGNTRVYTIHVTREADSNQYPLDIIINGLVPSLCGSDPTFCQLNPATFDKGTNTYYLTVPSRIKQLYFDVQKGHEYQTVTGSGKISLVGGENVITIEVESEDGLNRSVYTYYVTRDMTGNADLKDLKVLYPTRDLHYDPDILEYYISVPNEITEFIHSTTPTADTTLASNILQIYAEPDDENATMIISGENGNSLSTGMNLINILVTASNGEVKNYVLHVYREKNENVYLDSLQVFDTNNMEYKLSPSFSKINTGTYTVTVPNNISTVNIVANPEVSTTKVSGVGLKNLVTAKTNSFSIITTSENGTVETYRLNIIREKNNNTYLSDIKVSSNDKNYDLDPTFHKETLEYEVEVLEGTTTIQITATPEVSTTTYKLLDNNVIKLGENKKRIMAIAENGDTRTYTIKIHRPAFSDSSLLNLTATNASTTFDLNYDEDGNTKIGFRPDITNYYFTVENEINNITITSTKNNSFATIKGNGKYSLAVGNNQIAVVVKAEDGSETTYSLNITRKTSSNAYIKTFKTEKGSVDTTHDNFTYSQSVDADTTSLTIQVIPEVSTTKITPDKVEVKNLVTGNNAFTFESIAEDGTRLTYTFVIQKLKSSNALISSLIMEEGAIKPTFDKNTHEYTAKVPRNVEKGTFHITLDDPRSKLVSIVGNDNFVIGENEVMITIEAEDGTQATYKVIVTRQELTSNYLTDIQVMGLTSNNYYALDPMFEKGTPYYEVSVPYSETRVNISVTNEDLDAKVTGTGDHNLVPGDNLIVIEVTSLDNQSRSYQIRINREKSPEARLSNLELNGLLLSPSFDKDTFEYSVNTTNTSLNFSKIIPMEKDATYEILDNNFHLVNQVHDVIVRVTAPDEIHTLDYIIHVTRSASDNNNLSLLAVDGETITPNFVKTNTIYYLTVPRVVNNINVIATPEDSLATVTGDGSQDLNVGVNYVSVEVTSESGKTKTYIIVVTREASSNNKISSMDIHNAVWQDKNTFAPDNLGPYHVELSNDEDSLDFSIILDDENATYKILNNHNLKVGQNEVTIQVTAEDGTVREYQFIVNRLNYIGALLKDLKAKNYELLPNFNSHINHYTILANYETTELDLTVIPKDENATYTVTGNENFTVGDNTITIEVVSSDGKAKETYMITVTRQPYANNFLDYLYTSEGDVTPLFSGQTLEYSITVANSVSEIELFGEPVDKSNVITTTGNLLSSSTTEGSLGTYSLNTGDNKVIITVTHPSGIKRNYIVNIYREKSTDNYLLTLTANNGSTIFNTNPTFDKEINEYTIEVPTGFSEITLSGIVSENATVTGLGTHTLKTGLNTVNITVTSENGDVRTYKIQVNKEASSNNFLTDLIPSIGKLEPNFDYTLQEYTINLDSAASILSFTYYVEDPNATVSGTEQQIVPEGTSTRNIVVKAEDGTTRTYVITIHKQRNDISTLQNLYVENYKFIDDTGNEVTFDPNVYEYKIQVPNSKKILLSSEVIATTTDPNATIKKSANVTLSTTNENKFIVTVTAPNGFTKAEYTIYITRGKSNVASLNNLQVNIGHLESVFNPTVNHYVWKVPPTRKTLYDTDVTVTLADINSSYVNSDGLEVIEGNVYEVVITSEDGTNSTTYYLTVSLDLSSDARLDSLQIDKGYYKPVFDSDTHTYDVYEYIDTDKMNVTAQLKNENAKITSGIGEVLLPTDEVVHMITVQAEDGTIETYTLNIHKTILKDEGLADLGLNGLDKVECLNDKCILSPLFSTDVIQYQIKVPYEYQNLELYTKKMNEQQTVKYKIGDKEIDPNNYPLPVGKTVVSILVYDGMNTLTKTYSLEIERCESANNYLQSLIIDGYDISPTFDKKVLEYTINVEKDINEVKISAIPEDSNAQVSMNGYNYLQDGNNDAEITVTAVNGETRTYIVHIIKNPEFNSYLKNITVSTGIFWDLEPKFKSTTFEYTTHVGGSYDKVTLEATPVDTNAKVVGTGEFKIKTGSNIFTITATAVDGSVSIYRINVIKELSRDVDIMNLIVEEGNLTPAFDKGTTKYDVNVSSEVEKLTIHVTLEDKNSTYIITGNEYLVTGDNIVSIIVMSQDKSVSKTYQLVVHKAVSTNNNLSDIKVMNTLDNTIIYPLSPSFKAPTLDYTVTVNSDIDCVSVTATSENAMATISGLGEESLDYGNNLKTITVTAESGDTKDYTVNIYRKYNLNLSDIVSDIGVLTPEFKKDTLEYSIDVGKDAEKIVFIALPESNKVTVEGNGEYNLKAGKNEILLKAVAPDNTSKTYRVVVNREASDNNYIESLIVHEGKLKPDFDKTVEQYEVDVRKNVESLTMDITLEDKNATYEVIGNQFTGIGNHFVTIRVTAENKETRDYEITVHVLEDSEFSNRLLDLSISDGKLNPDFDPDTNYYAVTVPNSVNSTIISATRENSDAKITGIGQVNLEVGRNIFYVTVTSKDGIDNVYTLVIYRNGTNDATLSSLRVTGQNFMPIFNKTIENYTMTVEGEVTDLEIEAIPTEKDATVEITGDKNLITGNNTVSIKVTAPDGVTTKTYTIQVTKTISTNNYLSSLEVVGYDISPEFIKTNQGPYTLEVENNVNSIVVNATTESSKATLTGDGKYDLEIGKNIISLQVTSESGDVRIYTVVVNRKASSDSTLKQLVISDSTLEPTFDPTITEYTVRVEDVLEEITVIGFANDSKATVSGNGKYDLTQYETVISLTVTAEDRSKTTYTIKVLKGEKKEEEEFSSKLSELVIKQGELTPSFHKNTTDYSIKVPYEITSLQDMIIETEDKEATYEVVGNSDFKVGNNEMKIMVTSRDKSSITTYTIMVNRQIQASNYLSSLVVDGYPLDPIFHKLTLYYEVEVPNTVDSVEIKATAEDSSSIVTGIGVKSLQYGKNTFYVTNTSASGSVRTYTVVINRTEVDDNLLLTLETSVGTLTPDFNPEVNEYTLTVPEKTTSLELIGTVSPNTKVVGLGMSNVTLGEQTRTITVTSQTGNVNIYTVKVVRPASNNTNLIDLIPSVGLLDYSNDILEYGLEVEDNVSVLSFTAELEDKSATITGCDLTTLEYGNNEILITVTAEDGVTTREIKVNVTRKKGITEIIPENIEITLGKGETEQIKYSFNPSDTSYKEVEWASSDESIVMVDEEGTITGISSGSTTVQITSVHNPNIMAVVTVNVISKEITSSVYEIHRDTEVKYTIGADPRQEISEFIKNFDNNPSTLFLYDRDGNKIEDFSSFVGSYMVIKLIIKDVTYDELEIGVRGDLDGDGMITVADMTTVKNIILKTENPTFVMQKVSDTDGDSFTTVADMTKIKNYILKTVSSLNP